MAFLLLVGNPASVVGEGGIPLVEEGIHPVEEGILHVVVGIPWPGALTVMDVPCWRVVAHHRGPERH